MLAAIARVPGSAYPRARRTSGEPILAEFHRTTSMTPVSVQVITYAPIAFRRCQHCELAFREMGSGQRVRGPQASEVHMRDVPQESQARAAWLHHPRPR